ncbi:MAG: DUF3800 domain-containing protein [Candidatus Tectomicrobia bacterium]|uniref:DUF3800 domain-containing protein n=1 Tax=Tectimicrobiota bacterium TaxID=2528274 RepID=A0A932I1P5_UNCTE|nr:DUF3800 domain-containing protein [Candidatus Tectomicrobia bacterium]
MLFFVDESLSGVGPDGTPYNVLCGVAIKELQLWNLIQAIRSAEKEYFGMPLKSTDDEFKGKKLLKRKTFRLATSAEPIALDERTKLVLSFLEKGQRKENKGSRMEFAAYGQAKIAFVHKVFDLCQAHQVVAFASIVSRDAKVPSGNFLRKDYSYLFQRFFYFLETQQPDERGIVVFDEFEKTKCKLLGDQMSHYFSETIRGRARSSRIIPEPFFVMSDLTTATQIADICAYCLNWGLRIPGMREPTRPEMEPYGKRVEEMRFFARRYSEEDGREWPIFGFSYIDDLRPKEEKVQDFIEGLRKKPQQGDLPLGKEKG